MSVSGCIGFLSSWVGGRVSDRVGRRSLIASGSLISNICNFTLPLTGDVTQATGVLSARSVGFDINMPAMRALRADITPAEARGRYFGMFRPTWTARDIIDSIIGTYLYDIYRFRNFGMFGLMLPGYGIPYFVNSFLGIATIITLLTFVKEPACTNIEPR
jgi:MFS family permease